MDTYVAKGIGYANEQILLFGIRKELNVPLTAVVINHGEAGCCEFRPIVLIS